MDTFAAMAVAFWQASIFPAALCKRDQIGVALGNAFYDLGFGSMNVWFFDHSRPS
jgi:hypothetical protein